MIFFVLFCFCIFWEGLKKKICEEGQNFFLFGRQISFFEGVKKKKKFGAPIFIYFMVIFLRGSKFSFCLGVKNLFGYHS